MQKLSELFTRMKAWQLFMLFVVPLLLAQFYIVSNLFQPGQITTTFDPDQFNSFVISSVTLTAVMILLVVGWMASIMHAANRRIPQDIRPSIRRATKGGLFAVAYGFASINLWPRFIRTPPEDWSQVWLPLFFLVHMLATLGMFYLLWSAAKNLVMAEKQRTVSFGNVFWVILMLWFAPIGLWFLQPRVNRLVSDSPSGRF